MAITMTDLYTISDDYIMYLSQFDSKVSAAKINERKHERKYFGPLFEVNGIKYFAPLQSPKRKNFRPNGLIRKDQIWLTEIITTSQYGKPETTGKVNFSNMVPVPELAYRRYDLANEQDENYRAMITKEWDFLVKHSDVICLKASVVYNLKMAEKTLQYVPNFLTHTVDFTLLEEKCRAYQKLTTFNPNYAWQSKAHIPDQTLTDPAPVSVTNERNY